MTKREGLDLVGLEGVDALITGSSRGLGFGIARAFAAEGARVWMVADMQSELEVAASEIRSAGGRVEARTVDLADPAQRTSLTAELRANAPALRVVVNNAAVLERERVEGMDLEHWEHVLALNLTAPVMLTRDLVASLTSEGGSIINVSSRAGVLAFSGQAAYCASKFGIEAATRCLALELAGSRVSANTVTPGLGIKPTSITVQDADALDPSERAAWADPIQLAPAFRLLAGLRGQVSGYRFDALALTTAIAELGVAEALARIDSLAEHVPPALDG